MILKEWSVRRMATLWLAAIGSSLTIAVAIPGAKPARFSPDYRWAPLTDSTAFAALPPAQKASVDSLRDSLKRIAQAYAGSTQGEDMFIVVGSAIETSTRRAVLAGLAVIAPLLLAVFVTAAWYWSKVPGGADAGA